MSYNRGNNYKLLTIRFFMIYENISLCCAHVVNIWNNLPNSVVNASTVNAFKAWLDIFLVAPSS